MISQNPDHDVVLLNNDVLVKENWLSEMYLTASRYQNVGIVGAKVLNPSGTLQEFGSEIYEDGNGRNYGKGDNPSDIAYRLYKIVPYASGCCLFIKRSTFDKIGVLDTRFHPLYFEDSDFCYRALEHGILTMVTPKSEIVHFEGASAGKDLELGFKRFQKINQDKFLSKHRTKMKSYRKKIKLANNKLAKSQYV